MHLLTADSNTIRKQHTRETSTMMIGVSFHLYLEPIDFGIGTRYKYIFRYMTIRIGFDGGLLNYT